MYAGFPIIWDSKIQTQIALSDTEAEYMALSKSLWGFVPVIQVLNKTNSRSTLIISDYPKVYCKAFKYKFGALELLCISKL